MDSVSVAELTIEALFELFERLEDCWPYEALLGTTRRFYWLTGKSVVLERALLWTAELY